jgi:hypothetical protein
MKISVRLKQLRQAQHDVWASVWSNLLDFRWNSWSRGALIHWEASQRRTTHPLRKMKITMSKSICRICSQIKRWWLINLGTTLRGNQHAHNDLATTSRTWSPIYLNGPSCSQRLFSSNFISLKNINRISKNPPGKASRHSVFTIMGTFEKFGIALSVAMLKTVGSG